jgi:hypothetical protein
LPATDPSASLGEGDEKKFLTTPMNGVEHPPFTDDLRVSKKPERKKKIALDKFRGASHSPPPSNRGRFEGSSVLALSVFEN